MSDRKRHKTKVPGVFWREAPNGDRRYGVWFSDGAGRPHTKMLTPGSTLEDARRLKAELDGKAERGYVPSKKTVSQLLDDWLESRRDSLAPSSYDLYKLMVNNHLKPAFGRRRVEELFPSDIARLISDMKKKGLKAWTIKKALSPLSGAYRVAVRDGSVDSSPVGKLLPHEKPENDQTEKRILSSQEIQSLLSATPSLRWKTLFSLLCFTGLRISEALSLTWDDILEDRLVVRSSKTAAGVREVILIPSVKRLLSAWKLKQAPGATHVFQASQNRSVSRRGALQALRTSCRAAELPNYTLHELRHTFASILIAQKETLPFIQKQMGHANPEVTLRVYAKLFEEQESMTKARDRLQAMAEPCLGRA